MRTRRRQRGGDVSDVPKNSTALNKAIIDAINVGNYDRVNELLNVCSQKDIVITPATSRVVTNKIEYLLSNPDKADEKEKLRAIHKKMDVISSAILDRLSSPSPVIVASSAPSVPATPKTLPASPSAPETLPEKPPAPKNLPPSPPAPESLPPALVLEPTTPPKGAAPKGAAPASPKTPASSASAKPPTTPPKGAAPTKVVPFSFNRPPKKGGARKTRRHRKSRRTRRSRSRKIVRPF
jgi:hypothetical protein